MDQQHENQIKQILEDLEKNIKSLFESERYKNYLDTMSKFHSYSTNNCMLINMQKPDATYVAGYKAWEHNFNRHVNKGEKAIKIIAPSPYKITKEIEKINPKTNKPIYKKNGEIMTEKVEVTVPAYKVTWVFDIKQTHGEELPELAKQLEGSVDEYSKYMEAYKAISPVPIEFKQINSTANGYYHAREKKIVIKPELSQAQTLKTAIHEIAHAILHDKDTGLKKENIPDKQTREVEAESIAYAVCKHLGIDTSDYSFGYIALWSSDKEINELKNSMNTIREASSEIIKGIEKKLFMDLEREKAQIQEVKQENKTVEKMRQQIYQKQVKHHRRH